MKQGFVPGAETLRGRDLQDLIAPDAQTWVSPPLLSAALSHFNTLFSSWSLVGAELQLPSCQFNVKGAVSKI